MFDELYEDIRRQVKKHMSHSGLNSQHTALEGVPTRMTKVFITGES